VGEAPLPRASTVNQPGAAELAAGATLFGQGRFTEAVEQFRQAVRLQPGSPEALNNLGVALKELGQLEEAVASLRQAQLLRPDYAEAHNNLGVALKAQGKLADAVTCYQQALRLQPQDAEVCTNLGNALREQGQREQALACYQEALRLRPGYARAHMNLGNLLQEQGHLEQALACYQQAVVLRPDSAEAHTNQGNVLKELGQLAEAVACYECALRRKPDLPEAHMGVGLTLQQQGQHEKAHVHLQRAVRLKPNSAETHNSLGVALQDQGQLAEAQACYEHALRLQPDYARAHANLAAVLQEQGRLEQALASYGQALCLTPDDAEVHWNRALTWLLAGDFEQGWPEFEWRWRLKKNPLPQVDQPPWDGSPLEGRTILLYAEQGLGDTLQFIRYAPLVQERGGRVVVKCPAAWIPLLRRCPGIDELVAQGSPLPSFAVWAPLLSLPRILGTTLATIPASIPYLSADPQLTDYWGQELASMASCKIGIGWEVNPRFRRLNHRRCIPLVEFAPLARLQGVRLFSLQKESGVEQLRGVADVFPLTDLGSRLDETAGAFMDTAAVMQHLDLVVCADISLAHLAGALGVPVWLALPVAPNWRWLLEREDSPWYPTMQLFRQRHWGDWTEVFQRLATALEQRLAQRGYAAEAGPQEGDRSGSMNRAGSDTLDPSTGPAER
jgi:tetratricopeptide (TPR) repeat protein